LPGAQQLELLRRLNLAGRPGAALGEAVLTASAAGRGRPDLELAGAVPESAFGPAPVDPAALPPGELVRVAASVLADQVADEGLPPPEVRREASRWRRGYRLVGDPELADPLREQLVARGRPPGGREPRLLVVGGDLATMTAHAWTHRAFTEGVNSWREWLRQLQERREVPARADLLAVCRAWERRVGKARVHVVLDLRDVPRLVGDRRPLVAPAPVAGEAGELARRVGSVLGLLVLPDARETLLTTRLRPRVEAAARTLPATSALVVPPDVRDWVESAAERMRQGIKRAGYAVHGDLDALVPRWSAPAGTGVGPTPQATLDLAVRVLLDERRTA
ncbi:MAG TPA: hypothetical protein VFQ17_01955, partial [Nocardioides sp.]|nr:hypothetical protein [Nocardioides sp.]